jgi:chromosome segregation ATPase
LKWVNGLTEYSVHGTPFPSIPFSTINKQGDAMTDQADLPNVSMANTKKELLDAYEIAKKRFESQSKDLLDAEKARKRMEKQVATATADAQVAQDPVQRLHDLRSAISRELGDLAERFENEIETYRKIQSAIGTKQAELKTIYEVETAASDLAALIDAQRIKKEQFDQEMNTQKAVFEIERQEMRTQWQREKTDHDRQIAEEKASLKKERQREKEEYEYAFNREKEQRKNALEDELQTLEKEIVAKRGDFDHSVQERTAALDVREEAVAAREKDIEALRKEVDAFPKRLETAVQTAVADTTRQLTRDFESEKALMQARFDGEKNVLTGKIEALEKMVGSQETQIRDLSKKSEQAYEKVQDIANKAVSASRRESYAPLSSRGGIPVRDEDQG